MTRGFPLFPTWPGYWSQNRRNWKGGGKGQGRDVVLTSARSALTPSVAPYAMPCYAAAPPEAMAAVYCMALYGCHGELARHTRL